jgi:hypothetical protein
MLLTTIQTAIRDLLTTETITDAKLNRLIAAAVRRYSRYAPKITDYTLTTVGDDATYQMPAGCLGIKNVLYPSLDVGTYTPYTAQEEILGRNPQDYPLWGNVIVDDVNQDEYLGHSEGKWEYRPADRMLVINPTPGDNSTTVAVEYYTSHSLNTGGTGYDTIPDEDLEVIRDLSLAQYLRGKSVEIAYMPDYKEGLEAVTNHFGVGTIREAIDNLEGQALARYAHGAIAETMP